VVVVRVLVLVDQAGCDEDAAVPVVRPAAGEGLERVLARGLPDDLEVVVAPGRLGGGLPGGSSSGGSTRRTPRAGYCLTLRQIAGSDYRGRPDTAPVSQVRIDCIVAVAPTGNQQHDFATLGTNGASELPHRLIVDSACRSIHGMRVPVSEIAQSRIRAPQLLNETTGRAGR
jgi:hypothetical protein